MYEFYHALYNVVSAHRLDKRKRHGIKDGGQLHQNLHSLNYVDYDYVYTKDGYNSDSRSTAVTRTELELEFSEETTHNQSVRQAVSN